MHLNTERRGFSLIELVIVVVIIGIIGAIAIPRMSRGAAGASDSAVKADVASLRNAIELYRAEHNGKFPTVAAIEDQLTKFSTLAGDSTQDTKDSTHLYGPYLYAIPTLKAGPEAGASAITDTDGTASKGWVYSETTGKIFANVPVGTAGEDSIDYRDY